MLIQEHDVLGEITFPNCISLLVLVTCNDNKVQLNSNHSKAFIYLNINTKNTSLSLIICN